MAVKSINKKSLIINFVKIFMSLLSRYDFDPIESQIRKLKE